MDSRDPSAQPGSPQHQPPTLMFPATGDTPTVMPGPAAPLAAPGGSRRPRRGSRRPLLIAVVAALLIGLVGGGAVVWRLNRSTPPVQGVPSDVAIPVRNWPSGVWTGGEWGTSRVQAFGEWRGSPVDTAVTYPAYQTWQELAESDWHVAVFDGFEGRLVYGLPLLPKDSAGRGLDEVAAGQHDDAFTAVADSLLKHGRGDSYVRVGLEAQGDWFPWGASNGENTPEQFRAAFAHVSQLLKARMPQAQIVFDTSCGAVLRGQQDRMDVLNALYPGDDVVDVVGCDNYDHYSLISRTDEQFTSALRPEKAAGLQDTLDFARAHGKKFAVPEWGLTAERSDGGGDNEYFVYAMYMWFAANADDVAFENYFNEPDEYLGSSIWDVVQNPTASQEYRKLWGFTGSSPSPTPAGG